MGMIRVTLRELLDSHGKTAYWLAEEVQKSKSAVLTTGAVYNIVAGRANPSLDSIAQIMDVLCNSLDENIEIWQVMEYDPNANRIRPPKNAPRKSAKQLEREAILRDSISSTEDEGRET